MEENLKNDHTKRRKNKEEEKIRMIDWLIHLLQQSFKLKVPSHGPLFDPGAETTIIKLQLSWLLRN